MIRILVADDHPIILWGIDSILRDTAYRIVGKILNGPSVLEAVDELRPDILILDERMPGMSGVEVLRRLRERDKALPTVMLTGEIGGQRLLEALALGVQGIVLKESAQDRLLTCLDEVVRGGRWIEPTLLQQALDLKMREGEDQHTCLSALSPREKAIAELVSRGLRNREIAAQLNLTEGTVKVYLHRIYEKLGVASRIELTLRMREALAT